MDKPKPHPQARLKDPNSALSKRLARKIGPIGDDRQVLGMFRRVCPEYGFFTDHNNVAESELTITPTVQARTISDQDAAPATYHRDIRQELIDIGAAENEAYGELTYGSIDNMS